MAFTAVIGGVLEATLLVSHRHFCVKIWKKTAFLCDCETSFSFRGTQSASLWFYVSLGTSMASNIGAYTSKHTHFTLSDLTKQWTVNQQNKAPSDGNVKSTIFQILTCYLLLFWILYSVFCCDASYSLYILLQ